MYPVLDSCQKLISLWRQNVIMPAALIIDRRILASQNPYLQMLLIQTSRNHQLQVCLITTSHGLRQQILVIQNHGKLTTAGCHHIMQAAVDQQTLPVLCHLLIQFERSLQHQQSHVTLITSLRRLVPVQSPLHRILRSLQSFKTQWSIPFILMQVGASQLPQVAKLVARSKWNLHNISLTFMSLQVQNLTILKPVLSTWKSSRKVQLAVKRHHLLLVRVDLPSPLLVVAADWDTKWTQLPFSQF